MDDKKRKKQGRNIEEVREEQQEPVVPTPPVNQFNAEEYIVVLKKLRAPIPHITAVPTDTPKNFIDSFRLYDSGGTRRLYVFINATWRYVALT